MVKSDDEVYAELTRLNNELVNLQRSLAKKNAALDRSDRLKTQFLGMAAHDLRKSLGAIVAYTEFVVDEAGPFLSDEHRGFLEIVLDSARGMGLLIDDYLVASLAESGNLLLKRKTTAVTELVSKARGILDVIGSRRGVELVVDLPDGLPAIDVDPVKLEQVLVNLVANAIEHSDAGQRVSLTASSQPSCVVFRIIDKGCGISSDRVDALLESTQDSAFPGGTSDRRASLGLAIVKRIVDAHGGTVDVDTVLGEGSTFTVVIPLGDTGQ